MDFTLYTFGGGEALWKVFNGIALMFKSDSGMNAVMKLSMTVGGVWAAMRAMWGANVGIFARDYFIPTYLILNLMLIPTAPIHIIDEVNPDFHYAKVDRVPIGIAAVASTASHLSKLLTNMLERSLQPAEANQYGKTGPLFAARLVAMARDIQIVDPVEKGNLKEFVRQCYTLPYIWTNIKNKKKEALETQDILGFIAANPHKWLGSYWKDSATNESKLLYCQQGARRAIARMALERPRGLADLASHLFGSSQVNATQASVRLNRYFNDAWQTLSHQTRSAHNIAEQAMMMNVYRESVDDQREKFGMTRLNPQLIAASSARAKFQQNSGFLVSAQMVSSMLPSLQSTMLAILCILFVIVIPMSMLPGGLKTLGMWIKLILWVESWPVFYTIINSVGLIMASNRGAGYLDQGAGLSLLTQNGLADAAYDAYCYAEGFMAVVPVMAWAVISGGGYALANLSGTVTRSVDGLASKLGSEMTDGNLSFDNQNYHNESVANRSMAQQPGVNINWGMSHSDGGMTIITAADGKHTFNEARTDLAINTMETENSSVALSKAAERATNASHSQSASAAKSVNDGLNETYNLAKSFSDNSNINDSSGHTNTAGSNKDLKKAYDIARQVSDKTGLSEEEAFSVLANTGVSSGALKFLGINFGASADTKVAASNSESVDKVKSTGLQDQFNESLSRGVQYSFGKQGSYATQDQKQAAESIQGHFNRAKSYQEQSQASLTESENYRKAATISETSGWGVTAIKNDEVIAHVAKKRHGNSGEVAIQETLGWMRNNPDAYKQEAASYMAERHKPLIEALKSKHALTEGQIRERFEDFNKRVPFNVGRDDINHVKDLANEGGLGDKAQQIHNNNLKTTRENTGKEFKNTDQEINKGKQNIETGSNEINKKFNEINPNQASRVVKRIFNPETGHPEDTPDPTTSSTNPGTGHNQQEGTSLGSSITPTVKTENTSGSYNKTDQGNKTSNAKDGTTSAFNPSDALTPTGHVAHSQPSNIVRDNPPAVKPTFNVDSDSSQTRPSANSSDQVSESPSNKIETEPEDWSARPAWGENSSSSNAEWPSNSPSPSTVSHSGNQTPVSWSSTPPTATEPYSGGYTPQGSNTGGYGGYPASMTPISTVDPNSSQTTPSSQQTSGYPQTSNLGGSVHDVSPTPPSSMTPQGGGGHNQGFESSPTKVEINTEGWNPPSSNAEWPSNPPSLSPVDMNPYAGNQTPVSWSSTPPTATEPYSGGYPSQESPTLPSSIAPQGTEIPFVAPPDLTPDPTQAKIKTQARELKELKQSMETPHSQESEGAGNLPPTSGPITK